MMIVVGREGHYLILIVEGWGVLPDDDSGGLGGVLPDDDSGGLEGVLPDDDSGGMGGGIT